MTALRSIREHWPEYAIEAGGLATFMIAAGVTWTVLVYPGWPSHAWITDPVWRRAIMGLAMGLTAVALIYSPWGRQSGAHFNPAITLTFLRLKKIAAWDAAFYVIAQFVGAWSGVLLTYAALGDPFGRPPVEFIVTVPGNAGELAAFAAELGISFALMLMVLYTSNRLPLVRYTGVFAGILIAVSVTFEAPLSGMSMNPARTLASALPSRDWDGLWIYFTAPLIGMIAAVDAYRLITKEWGVICAKLNHDTTRRCIFDCEYRKRGIDVPQLLQRQPSLPIRHPLASAHSTGP